jgi:hypothetical protein
VPGGRHPHAVSAVYRPATCGLSPTHSGKLDMTIRWYAEIGAKRFWWVPKRLESGDRQWNWERIPDA